MGQEQQQQLNCAPPCAPLIQMQEDMSAMRTVLLGDRADPESMRKSVYGTVERWGNWMDATATVFRIAGSVVAAGAAIAGVAKAAGII